MKGTYKKKSKKKRRGVKAPAINIHYSPGKIQPMDWKPEKPKQQPDFEEYAWNYDRVKPSEEMDTFGALLCWDEQKLCDVFEFENVEVMMSAFGFKDRVEMMVYLKKEAFVGLFGGKEIDNLLDPFYRCVCSEYLTWQEANQLFN